MSESHLGTYEERPAARPVFVSYATTDRKRALSICKVIESRGVRCWISIRDVAPGENYQEAIVQSIRSARAVVLVFSKAANNSDEIKKELSLASRYHVPVIAIRTEDVEPSDAFAYELSTRQWIDGFHAKDRSIDALVSRIAQLPDDDRGSTIPVRSDDGKMSDRAKRTIGVAAVVGLCLLVVAMTAWWALRPTPSAAHSMTVRLAGFHSLSTDLPLALHATIAAETIAAFSADGVIGVSTAPSAPAGSGPAYALGGTIHRIGDTIRVITQFTNERSGVVLWSDSIDYPASETAKIPRRIAVDAGTVVRCGLFGASTYRKPLPDSVLGNYMQYCQEYWSYGGNKTLIPAQKVAAALPDFSWGWSAVANGFMQRSYGELGGLRAAALRASGLQAEARALALDPNNSEAWAHKAYLIDPHDWGQQEALFKKAIAARPLDCGCEHYGYGLTLQQVGRVDDAVDEFRAATDLLALWPDSQMALAQALVAAGKPDDAKPHFEQAIDLSKDSNFGSWVAVTNGIETGDFAAATVALRNPKMKMPEDTRAALMSGYRALAAKDPAAKASAVRELLALAAAQQNDAVATMLAALGANHEALTLASERPWLFWTRSMRGVLNDKEFPAVATKLGLLRYWKASHSRPDVCEGTDRPLFCRMIQPA